MLIRSLMKLIFSCVICTLFHSSLIAQSPWIQNVNNGFIQFSYSGLSYDQVQYNNTLITPARQTLDQTYQAYLDFGVLPKIGITASVPFKIYSLNQGVTKFSGLGNVEVGLKYQISSNKATSALGITYAARSQNANRELGLRAGFDAHTITPYYTIGSGTNKTYFYANFGYGIRTNDYSDFIRVSGEFGFQIFRNAYLIGLLDLTNPLQKESTFYNTDDPKYIASASFLDRQAFNAAGIKFNYDFIPQRYGISVSTIGALGLNNIPFARTYNVGIYNKF